MSEYFDEYNDDNTTNNILITQIIHYWAAAYQAWITHNIELFNVAKINLALHYTLAQGEPFEIATKAIIKSTQELGQQPDTTTSIMNDIKEVVQAYYNGNSI